MSIYFHKNIAILLNQIIIFPPQYFRALSIKKESKKPPAKHNRDNIKLTDDEKDKGTMSSVAAIIIPSIIFDITE